MRVEVKNIWSHQIVQSRNIPWLHDNNGYTTIFRVSFRHHNMHTTNSRRWRFGHFTGSAALTGLSFQFHGVIENCVCRFWFFQVKRLHWWRHAQEPPNPGARTVCALYFHHTISPLLVFLKSCLLLFFACSRSPLSFSFWPFGEGKTKKQTKKSAFITVWSFITMGTELPQNEHSIHKNYTHNFSTHQQIRFNFGSAARATAIPLATAKFNGQLWLGKVLHHVNLSDAVFYCDTTSTCAENSACGTTLTPLLPKQRWRLIPMYVF